MLQTYECLVKGGHHNNSTGNEETMIIVSDLQTVNCQVGSLRPAFMLYSLVTIFINCLEQINDHEQKFRPCKRTNPSQFKLQITQQRTITCWDTLCQQAT